MDKVPGVQSMALMVSLLLGVAPGNDERWINALVLRPADIILNYPTFLFMAAAAAAGRGDPIADGHDLLNGR
jgi:ABC-type dipeptide/oligopeptide/nickel transport system permease subunit